MKKTPCEHFIWAMLPVIRKMMACCMIHEHGLSQKKTADKLGLTPSAICNYVYDKRGYKKSIDEKIKNEINVSVIHIIENGEDIIESEICRICRFIKENDLKI